jgi:hypothetical protein
MLPASIDFLIDLSATDSINKQIPVSKGQGKDYDRKRYIPNNQR